MEAKVLPFKRPHLVVFERFDPEDMAATFRAKWGSDTYHFTLLTDGKLDEFFLVRDDQLVPAEECTKEDADRVESLYNEALSIYRDQLKTWNTLGPSEKMALLLHWGEEIVAQIKEAIVAAAADDPKEHAEEIALMCKDMECHEAYLSGIEAAMSLL